MDIIRNTLIDLGFRLTKKDISEGGWANEWIFEWETDQYRYGSHYVCITSKNNWYFEIERSFQGAETGVEGFSKYTCFLGSISNLIEFGIIMKCTGATNDIQEPNTLK